MVLDITKKNYYKNIKKINKMEPMGKTTEVMDSKKMEIILNEYQDFVQSFTRTTESITSIEDNHGFLIHYWKNFLRESKNFLCGVFVLDIFEIYTPVQDNDFGLVGFRKYPFKRQRVFALGDGFSSVYYKWGNFFIIFCNVVKTNKGYKFKQIPISSENDKSENKSYKEIPVTPCTIQPITLSVPSKQKAFFISSDDFTEGSLEIKDDGGLDDEDLGYRDENYIKKLRQKIIETESSEED